MPDAYYDLSRHRRLVTTSSPQAQLWFDRGFLWAYCFNPEEAVRCFERALEYDPQCVMAYWGIAYASGPNYNKAWIRFDRADLQQTVPYVQDRLGRVHGITEQATPVERALIDAIAVRFPSNEIPTEADDFHKLNLAYAEAMRTLYREYPDDMDVAALFGDALLCVSPRALWDLDSGEPVGYGTVEAREVIERAMSRPEGLQHPALPHLYIHLMEMSPYPEIALPAADRLRRLTPDGSHMAHMATHIDAACGDWRRVIDSNNDAIVADEKYFIASGENPVGWYDLYRGHNLYAKAYGAIMSGRLQDALAAVRRLEEIVTPDLLQVTSPPMADWAECFRTALPHVLIRFGRWEDILALELPQDQKLFCSTTTMIHYARGLAYAALGRVTEAEAARADFVAARATVPPTRIASIPVLEVDALQVAAAMLDGEIAYRKGNFDEAFTSLRRAIELEDGLGYADPPAWLQPVRHAYGALLLEQGRVEEAAATYQADLGLDDTLSRRRARPNNVWSLHGLHECLTRLGQHDEARRITLQREIAVASADVQIGASCFCRLTAFDDGDSNCCSTGNPVTPQQATAPATSRH